MNLTSGWGGRAFWLGAAGAAVLAIALCLSRGLRHGMDFNVYWQGARVYVSPNGNLYAPVLPGTGDPGLGFTYPPFAALLFAPMNLLPMRWALALQTMLTIAVGVALAVAIVRYLVLRGVIGRRMRRKFAAYAACIGVVLLSGPWQGTVALGQLNALLLALVATDILWDSNRPKFLPRGILTGIAAGIKLTPLAFLLFFVVKKDYKAAAWLLATFAATVGMMWLIAPNLSADFWLRAVFNTNRIGEGGSFNNLSIRGVVERTHLEGAIVPALWLSLSAATVAVGIVAMRKRFGSGDTWAALSINAIVMLLVSPVSWYHHWIWIAVVIPAFIASFKRYGHWSSFLKSKYGLIAALTTCGFLVSPGDITALTGSPDPYESISVLSEGAVSAGIVGPIALLLAWAIGQHGPTLIARANSKHAYSATD